MDFSTGLSGLRTAQRAIDLIGTNISNAATEGYHKQTLRLAPVSFGTDGDGQQYGVKVVEALRAVDELLENEHFRQQPLYGQTERELSILQTIESAFGEIGSEGLGTSIDEYYNALQELSSQPNSLVLREQAVWAADSMCTHLRGMGTFLANLEQQVVTEAENVVEEVNDLAGRVAELNREITILTLRGANPNVLLDQRDQAVNELGRLIEINVSADATWENALDILAVGTSLTISNMSSRLGVGITNDNKLGVGAAGSVLYSIQCEGGTLGGLMTLRNDIIPALRSELDALATEIAGQMNALHVQGVGSSGPFTQLDGWSVSEDDAFEDWTADLSAGSLYVRVTNSETGKTERHTINVTLDQAIADVVAALDGLEDADGTAALSASMVNGALHLEVTDSSKFTFDFLPAPLAQTDAVNWTGSAVPVAGGVYTGAANDTYTFTASGTGTVGSGDLSLEVRDSGGNLLTTLNIGDGYAPNETIQVHEGITLAISGDVADGDSFTTAALARSDETGLLAAAGVNVLFRGDSAANLGVRRDVMNNPALLAASLGSDLMDNANIIRMAAVGETQWQGLGGKTPADAYRALVTGVGQDVAARDARLESLDAVERQLSARRDELGAVDINEEAARLMIFQRMFEASARFLSTQFKTVEMLGEMV